MNNLKRYILAALAAALFAGPAHAGVVGESSDDKKVEVGASTVSGGPHAKGLPGIGLIGNEQLPKGIVDFYGLTAYARPDSHGVSSLTYPSSAPTDHSKMGVFHFAKVSGADVYFGEWSQTSSVTDGTHTVYYAGDDSGATVPASGIATYSVKGISDYANKGLLSGTFYATFAPGGGGTLSGILSNSASKYSLEIGQTLSNPVFIKADGTFSGEKALAKQSGATLANNGKVSGRFFGAGARALAGLVTFQGKRQYDTAFGGSQNVPVAPEISPH